MLACPACVEGSPGEARLSRVLRGRPSADAQDRQDELRRRAALIACPGVFWRERRPGRLGVRRTLSHTLRIVRPGGAGGR